MKKIIVVLVLLFVNLLHAQSVSLNGKNGGKLSITLPKDFQRDDTIPGFSDKYTIASFKKSTDSKTFISVTEIPQADFAGKKWEEIISFIKNIECEGTVCETTKKYESLDGYCREFKAKRSLFSFFMKTQANNSLLIQFTQTGGKCSALDSAILKSIETINYTK